MPREKVRSSLVLLLMFGVLIIQAPFVAVHAEGEEIKTPSRESVVISGAVVKADYFFRSSSELVQFTIKTNNAGKKGLEVCQVSKTFRIRHWNDEIYGLLIDGIKVIVTGEVMGDKNIIYIKKIEFPEIERLLPPPVKK